MRFKFPKITIEDLKQTVMVIPILATYYLIDKKVFSVSVAEGKSMEPTMGEGSILLIDRFFYKWTGGIKKDDIIIAVQPVNPDTHICKRVVELGGNFYRGVNIPVSYFWLEGDNKRGSYDSRHHGPVPQYLIEGRVIAHFTV